ncbi:hypothetical protein ROJ8625_00137 [Roseivivax jejudonensis]|uniref:Uncharacterized protein n=1 Tax=Roseivivax jejudonensis TaxID=1529041 RepID=A0A1X6Y467_9RHOB|nr:hypothetical protein [Roseivivax jejudonensis]SLN09977.1 hypothetical protein ROJ8625_00137 [Roseivivax jejudonensis]
MMSAAEKSKTKPDLTMVRDPASIWPDPFECPDYPLTVAGERLTGAYSRAQAEQKLRTLSKQMNGNHSLHKPSEHERSAALSTHFKQQRGHGPARPLMNALGFTDMAPTQQGKLIAQAVHLRGYLRKLEARDAEREKAAQERREHKARSKLERYSSYVDGLEAEADELLARAERYRQFLADKAAYHRVMDLRTEIDATHREAATAAAELGEPSPDRPAWIDKLTAFAD